MDMPGEVLLCWVCQNFVPVRMFNVPSRKSIHQGRLTHLQCRHCGERASELHAEHRRAAATMKPCASCGDSLVAHGDVRSKYLRNTHANPHLRLCNLCRTQRGTPVWSASLRVTCKDIFRSFQLSAMLEHAALYIVLRRFVVHQHVPLPWIHGVPHLWMFKHRLRRQVQVRVLVDGPFSTCQRCRKPSYFRYRRCCYCKPFLHEGLVDHPQSCCPSRAVCEWHPNPNQGCECGFCQPSDLRV